MVAQFCFNLKCATLKLIQLSIMLEATVQLKNCLRNFQVSMLQLLCILTFDRPFLSVVAPGFKNKTRYAPYVSLESQLSHIATNKGNINR